ncbi:MAG: hypothetical protein Q7S62_00495 [bacterium]|nr:hypothetical protein [bacterium]
MEIQVSERFRKNYRKLPKRIKERAKQKESIFRGNPFDSGLKTHKLSGKEEGRVGFLGY